MFYNKSFTIASLLEVGAHYGHRKNYWNPKVAEYIYCIHNKIHIINLEKTAKCLESALTALKDVAYKNGRILFVSTKKQAADTIAEQATRCGQYYVNNRWLGGMLTNWKTVSSSIKTLNDYEQKLTDEDNTLLKKEKLVLNRKRDKLHKVLGGIRKMGGVPDALFVIGLYKNENIVREAKALNIPVFAIIDTNCKLDGIDHIIPGNDDSRKAIELYCKLAADAILLGMQESAEKSSSSFSAIGGTTKRSTKKSSSPVPPSSNHLKNKGSKAAITTKEKALSSTQKTETKPAAKAKATATAAATTTT